MDARSLLKVTHEDDDPQDSRRFLAGMRASLANEWDDPCVDEDGSPSNWAFRCGWITGELSKVATLPSPPHG